MISLKYVTLKGAPEGCYDRYKAPDVLDDMQIETFKGRGGKKYPKVMVDVKGYCCIFFMRLIFMG